MTCYDSIILKLKLKKLKKIYFLKCRFVIAATDNSCNGNDVTGTGSCSKPEEDVEEGDIDEYLNTLEQDDPILIEAIKNYYLDKGNPNFPPVIPRDRLTDKRLAVS